MTVRGVLRCLLGQYLQREPNELRIGYGRHRKPRLEGDAGAGLHFSVSHSYGLALIGVSRGLPLGVDVEQYRETFPLVGVAQRFFSPEENAVLQKLPPDQQVRAFFDGWSRKEAYLKAIGLGLAAPLDKVSLPLLPSDAACLATDPTASTRTNHWQIHALSPAETHTAALAAPQGLEDQHCWQWTPCVTNPEAA